MKNAIITIFLTLVAPATSARSAELLVPSQYPTIQSAINAAVDGDTVIVAPGTYTGDGNRDIDFLGKAITVRSADPNDPNIVAATIIDCNGTAKELHHGFCFKNGEDSYSILDGLTITNGYGMVLPAGYTEGGGIACIGSSPTISNCRITGNTAADSGGGIYCQDSNPTIISCTIIGNSANYGGGAIGCYKSSPEISDCTIADNSAGFGGCIFCNGESSPTITNCTITGNSASRGGGGIYCDQSSSIIITNCIISGNSTVRYGGGIYCYDSNTIITSCAIIGNTAREGGGIFGCDGPITNCTIAENSVAGCSSRGGGLASCDGPIINCTIADNSAEYYGGGLTVGRKPFSPIKNCIIWNNWPDQIYGDYIPVAITYSDIQGGYPGLGNIDTDPCFVDADANDYHLKSEGWSWDTKRSCWTYDDVTSRCIDAGNPGSPLDDELLAVPRDPENIWGQNLRIDMGAFGGTVEASIPPYDWALLSDVTNDGISDLSDLYILSSLWLNTGEQLYADSNRDGIINLFDFALLAQDWLRQTSWH
jgi:parallel beta-helix repeat protein